MSKILSVPYFTQVNNSTRFFGSPYRQCNLTSTAMMLDFLQKGQLSARARANGFDEPESYYASKLVNFGDTTDHEAHTRCLKQAFGITSEWRYNLSKTDIVSQINKGFPVPIGVNYKASGHIICVVGYEDGGLVINDPYGTRNGADDSYQVGIGGERDRYSWDLLKQIFWLDGESTGWGRVVTALK